MKLAIMQPYLFPYIGYWQLVNAVDTFVIYDDVNFIKQGYINRNNILIRGCKVLFTLNLIGASSNKLINEIEVGNNEKKLLKTFRQVYSKAPFYFYVMPLIEQIFSSEEKNLAKFVGNSIILLAQYLQVETEFKYSSTIAKDNDLKAQDMVIEISKLLGATTYVNAIGGKGLYSKDVFRSRGLTLQFIKSKPTSYTQFNKDFVPNLSIIDVLMFNSVDDVRSMLNGYELI